MTFCSLNTGPVQIPLALSERDLDGLAKTAHFIERETGQQTIKKSQSTDLALQEGHI